MQYSVALGHPSLSNRIPTLQGVIAAPMAGVTDIPFRTMIRKWFKGLMFTEMLSAEAVVRGNSLTKKMMEIRFPNCGAQLVGSNPETMSRAAEILVDAGAAVVDVNAGCPDPHVVKKGGGAALLKTPGLLRNVVDAVGSVAPVSVKIRAGWKTPNMEGIAEALQDSGVLWTTMHPRLISERYNVPAEHERTRTMVELLAPLPVFASGDILHPSSAESIVSETSCAGVMVARGMRGDPQLPWRVEEKLRGVDMPPPSLQDRCSWLFENAVISAEYFGEEPGIKKMRKHAFWYLRGTPKRILPWREINTMVTVREVDEICQCVLKEMEENFIGQGV